MVSEKSAVAIIQDMEENRGSLRRLVEQLKTGVGVIPFVGAGLSIPLGFPSWTAFLRGLARQASIEDHVDRRLAAGEYEEAAQDLLDALGNRAFHDAVEDAFGDHILKGKALKGAVSVLPRLVPGPVVTTNFDHVLEEVFRLSGCPFEHAVWGARSDMVVKGFQQDRRFLLKVHGDFEDRTDRVLTLADYERHYGPGGLTRVDLRLPLPRLLNLMLMSRPLLFVGCSLGQDRTVEVLRLVAEGLPSLAHYAIVERPDADPEFRALAHHLANHAIRPIWYPHGRHDLLEPLLKYLARQIPYRPAGPARRGAPSGRRAGAPGLTGTGAARPAPPNLLRVVDLGGGRVQVSLEQGKGRPCQCPQAVPFQDPLSAEDRRDLRWYLEGYLQFPYGAERERAGRIERRMEGWGEALFAQIFPRGGAEPSPYQLYQEATGRGLGCCELCLSSDNPQFLGLPWELLRDPSPGRGYLAPLLGGLYRQRGGEGARVAPGPRAGEPFRILLVIARPYGERDVPLGTVARPVLEAIRPLRPRVEIEVLRPPTFDALVRRLYARRGHYHLVHFDGHGSFSGGGGSLPHFAAVPGLGHLAFENEDGTPHIVNSRELGQALADCGVGLFVLNACRSAEESGSDPFASVAAQLGAVGASGVVAMSYSVYASAAGRFMGRFYERLVGHATLAEAVAEGRRALYAEPHRESVVGPLELRDWMVPALHQEQCGYLPVPEGVGAEKAEEAASEVDPLRQAERVCPPGGFGFVGRDYDLLRLERALRDSGRPWALLTGVGGTGKTELARGFARWYAETGGCPAFRGRFFLAW